MTATESATFDVNDVSFLYPLPTTVAGIAAMMPMRPLTREEYEALVPTAKDREIHPHGGTEPNLIFDPNIFKVVAVRVDPCAKDDPRQSDCRIEVRLIMQPVGDGIVPFTPGIAAFDASLHLIYFVPASEKSELIAGLRRLLDKAQGRTRGKPLDVHPVLLAEGIGGPYDVALRQFVERFATPDRLTVATHTNVFESDRWMFHKVERVDGKLVRQQIPFANSQMQEFKTDGATHVAKIVKNPSLAPDNVNDIIDSFLPSSRFFQQSEATKTAQIRAAVRIDNPLLHSPVTLDCVSCHTATRALNRVSRDLGNTGGDVADRYVTPAGVTGNRIQTDENIWSIRAFGYFGKVVAITKGAINDSAKVAAALNANALQAEEQ